MLKITTLIYFIGALVSLKLVSGENICSLKKRPNVAVKIQRDTHYKIMEILAKRFTIIPRNT